jgi:hypothetical protein
MDAGGASRWRRLEPQPDMRQGEDDSVIGILTGVVASNGEPLLDHAPPAPGREDDPPNGSRAIAHEACFRMRLTYIRSTAFMRVW